MKKQFLTGLVAASMIFSATAFADVPFAGKQSASAYLDQDGKTVCVTVDLSDGWSVEFARGAVYLYDGPNEEGKEAAAIGITLDEEVYNEQLAIAQDQKNYRVDDGITAFTNPDGSQDYYFAVGDAAFFMITVDKNYDGDEVMSRIATDADAMGAASEIFSDDDIESAMNIADSDH